MALLEADARALGRVATIPLITLTLPDATALYISDRVKEYGGFTFEPLLESHSDIIESVDRLDSTALASDFSMLLRNDLPIGVYASLIELHETQQLDGARVDVTFLFVDGTNESAAVAVFSGIAEEPTSITRTSLTIRCSGIPEYKARAFALAKMFSEDYPLSLPSDSGKCFPELIGEFKTVECMRTIWPVYETDNITTLSANITDVRAVITCASTVGFEDDGEDEEKYIWIDDECILWGAKETTPMRFIGCVRGQQGTTAVAHTAGAEIREHPAGVSRVVLAKYPVYQVSAFHGEWSGLLSKVAPLKVKYGVGQTYAEFSKEALVVPQTLVDTINLTGGGAPDYTETGSNQGNLAFSCESTASANRTWPANPYLTAQGVPMYTALSLMIEWAVESCSGVDPDGTQHGSMFTADALLYIIINGTTYWLGGGSTTYIRQTGAPTYIYAISRHEVTTYMASIAAIPLPNLLDWGKTVACYFESDQHSMYTANISLRYRCLLNANAVAKTGTVKDEKYFRRIYATGWGRASDEVSTFYGPVNTAITRPDHVMKKWIVNTLGFAEGDIDTASFDEAGTFYAAQTPDYALSVRVTEDIDPLAELYRMAFESRSVVYFASGKWFLKVIPSAAPPADRTISASDLAGEGAEFVGGYTSRDDVVNSITVKWKKNDGPTKDEDPYRKSKVVSIAAGSYQPQTKDLELRMVYGQQQAIDVATVYLQQRGRVMKTISFPVFWDSSDIPIGETVAISGAGFWEGVKFWIDSASRTGVKRAGLTGIEWW